MAVIVKYIVVRNGEEKMTFATKKEADAHDKMLDIADNVFDFLQAQELGLSENQSESIALKLAENRDVLIPMLRGVAPKKKSSVKAGTTKEKPGKKASAKK
ncbi:MAG: hypothetical protein CSA26_00490 [Desulfobacterales bacterium]|nr:MAG: hypothetical protein CSA26_00490 [Desulfobacterales bacterium]